MNVKILRELVPDCRILWELADQRVGNRPHGDPNFRGQLLFSEPLTELSLNKSSQIHNGTPP